MSNFLVLQVSRHDLFEAAQALVKALTIREKYMAMALQSFPRTTAQFLLKLDKQATPESSTNGPDRQTIEGMYSSLINFVDYQTAKCASKTTTDFISKKLVKTA